VKRVFEITGLLPVLPIYESRVSAATALSATITAAFVDESHSSNSVDTGLVDESRPPGFGFQFQFQCCAARGRN
jgi:hypothetical protein